MDYNIAIQNLTDILNDKNKFTDMTHNIYTAIIGENEQTLKCNKVEEFFTEFFKNTEIIS